MANCMICPVCGEEVQDFAAFCPNCSFEMHILPDNCSPQILELEKTRTENAKRVFEANQKSLNDKNREVEQLNASASSLQTKIATLESSAQQQRNTLNSKQDEIAVMSQQIKRLNAELETAKQAAATSQTATSASAAKQPFAYLVVFNGLEAQLVLNLFEGENSFGTAPTNATHQQLLLGDDEIKEYHFAIKSSVSSDSKGRRRASYTLTPAQGDVYRAANKGNRIGGEERLEINDTFYAGSIRFTLLDNKNNKNKE